MDEKLTRCYEMSDDKTDEQNEEQLSNLLRAIERAAQCRESDMSGQRVGGPCWEEVIEAKETIDPQTPPQML